jgi:hypothetical protein
LIESHETADLGFRESVHDRAKTAAAANRESAGMARYLGAL